jgi:2-polyprenyl-6-methoxyphenol hydroxylase-like FAD-dependent oxidoreductase
MAKIVISGGGIVGLSTTMLLAGDGHQVTALERDPAVPPEDPKDAWEERRRRLAGRGEARRWPGAAAGTGQRELGERTSDAG